MKTKKEWNKSGLDLTEYLDEPCEINEELFNYILECTAPQYLDYGLGQTGEAEKHEDGVGYYMTVSFVNNKHFYLGILPEFVQ